MGWVTVRSTIGRPAAYSLPLPHELQVDSQTSNHSPGQGGPRLTDLIEQLKWVYHIIWWYLFLSLSLSLYIQLQLLMYVLLILAIIRWWCEGMWGPNAITRPKSEHSVLDIGTTLWQFLLELVHGAWWPWHFQTVQRWQTLQHSNYWALVRAVNDGWHGRSAAMLPIS